MTHNPFLPDIGVIALVPDRWTDVWQPRHHVMSRLARYFYVVWVEPPHDRHDMLRVRAEQRAPAHIANSSPGFLLYRADWWLPGLHRPRLLSDFICRQQLRRAVSVLREKGCRKIILYIWRPQFASALDQIPHDMSCYHIDDEYTFSDVELPLDDLEARLIARVGHVFIHSQALLEKKGHLNARTTQIPNGVDYHAYSAPGPEPADMAPIPRPRIGYTGMLKKQLDWPLILRLAAEHRDWSFVFVGPRHPHPEIREYLDELSQCRNAYFLGGKSVADLAQYPRHFNVCTMPYVVNDYTKFIYPLKLHEYLASGRPVVASPIRSLQEFAHLIRLARSREEWSRALALSVAEAAESAEQVEARRSVAREFDWGRLVWQIARTLAQSLDPEYLGRIQDRAPFCERPAFMDSVA